MRAGPRPFKPDRSALVASPACTESCLAIAASCEQRLRPRPHFGQIAKRLLGIELWQTTT
jgi:hypothetical protein